MNACESVAQCPGGSRCEPAADGRARCVRDDSDAGALPDAASDGGAPCAGPGCDRVVQIAAGGDFTCARTQTGAVWCWGEDAAVGDGLAPTETCGTVPCHTRPRRTRWLDEFRAEREVSDASWLAAGLVTACAVVDGGHPICWGRDSDGETGTGLMYTLDQGGRVRDVGLEYLTDATTLVPGASVMLAMRGSDPMLVGWGRNASAELRDGTQEIRRYAVTLDAVPEATRVVLGNAHGCAIRGAAGEVWCWGSNSLGQIGQGTPAADAVVLTALRAGDLDGVTSIALGNDFTCAIARGDAYCWGRRETLGVRDGPSSCGTYADATLCSASPTRVTEPEVIDLVSAWAGPTANDVCAIDARGRVWCWGRNEGAVSGPTAGDRVLEMREQPALAGATEVALGWSHGCALLAGDAWCWGTGELGELGRGPSATPDPVPGRVAW